ncbi:TPA: polymer-forming cytoskeletal protein [Escherichia coli]|uniref:bactofilin family protein n=1 Tax=Escherichia coli TaxID=562 RepID=UPI0007515E50|nr:polymer-forming cytoskeletal protein [Escherichia coli]EIQ4656928.1 polymer-forming cytoskeletal protein [Escherichia coli]KUS82058.1 hypothetical protein AWE77_21490 [Escherichia coli]HAZ3596130.1 polymer-forming cytoskeletal protein [Escherichia coli]HAZ3619599.1 polymer-forming cytoskeletal protein [Escherichia coli]HAZ3780140.1 polymer-forming cytoskeletal protein [Escherichia coli]
MLFWFASFCWLLLIILWGAGFYFSFFYEIFTAIIILLFSIYFLNGHMFSVKRKKSTPVRTIISESTSFVGDIISGEKIIIHGDVNGNINIDNGEVFIEKDGVVHGTIVCDKLVLNGEFYGECCCSVLLVHENGFLKGNVDYCFLEIRNGGCISGVVNKISGDEQSNVSELVKVREN